MALHALLALPSVKRMLSRLSLWVEGPTVEIDATVDTLCTILGELLRGKRATTKSFNVLRQDLVLRECLSRLACMEAPIVFQVLVDRLMNKLIAVGVDGLDAFLYQYTPDAGWIPPRGSLEMALRYVLTAPVQDNILRHLDDVWNQARVQFTGQLLCVHVDGGLVAGPVALDVLVRLLGRYRLRCVLMQCGQEWHAWVPGRCLNRNFGWFECLAFDVVPHEGLQSIHVENSALLLFELDQAMVPSRGHGGEQDVGSEDDTISMDTANELSVDDMAEDTQPYEDEFMDIEGDEQLQGVLAHDIEMGGAVDSDEHMPDCWIGEYDDAPALLEEDSDDNDEACGVEDFGDQEVLYIDDVRNTTEFFENLMPGLEYGTDDDDEEASPGVDPTPASGVDPAMEFLNGDSSRVGGLHILLATLAELNTKWNMATEWVKSFVTSILGRMPSLHGITEYVEAHAYVSHFPVVHAQADGINVQYPGCMPLRMYSKHTMQAVDARFVDFERYAYEALTDVHGTRQYDSSVAAYYFNVMLMRLLECGPGVGCVKRGLGASLQDYGSNREYAERFGDTILPGLTYDAEDAKRNVDMLVAADRKFGSMTYFGTVTVDMRRFPGMRELYEQLDTGAIPVEDFAVHMTRAWYRESTLFLRYIMESPDRPLGNARHMFAHAEWQDKGVDAVANFNHWHIGVWTDDRVDDPDPSVAEAANHAALARLTATIERAFEFLQDEEEIRVWEARAAKVQKHTCGPKCLIDDGHGGKVCKDGIPTQPHSEARARTIQTKVPEELKSLLLNHGLAHRKAKTNKVELHDSMIGKVYEAAREGWSNSGTSQFSPRFFVASGGCHQNWQVVHGRRFLLAYLVKYLSSEEERCLVRITKQGATIMQARVQDEQQRKRTTRQQVKPSHARLIGLSEIMFLVLQYKTVFCTFTANRVNIGSSESRFVVLRPRWSPERQASPIFGPDPFLDRNGYRPHAPRPNDSRCGRHLGPFGAHPTADFLHPLREPDRGQRASYHQWATSRYTQDKVLLYCLRPPEMLDMTLEEYSMFTSIDDVCKGHSLWKLDWVQRRERIMNWRENGMFDVRYKRVLLNPGIFTRPGLYRGIFERLGDSQAGEAIARAVQSLAGFREPWMHKLVDFAAKPVVVVYPQYAPSLNGNWMSSVVLCHAPPFTHEKSMVDEWMCTNCRTDQNGDWHAATHNLLGNLSLQRWVLEELSFWPNGVGTMFRIIEPVYEQLHGMGTYNMTSGLAFTDAELDEKHTSKYEAHLQSAYERHMEMLRRLSPWQGAADTEAASWQEQQDGMQLLLDRFDRLLYCMEQIVAADDIAAEGLPHIRPLYIEGPPGCGKTFVALQFVRKLFERGITSNQVEITCVSAYRASVLGGVHIHELFGFLPGNSNLRATPQSLAAVALRRLRKNPEKMRRLQELIVLVVDEFGQCGAELLVAMDLVLRKVWGTEHPFGGLLLVAAGDHYQTEPIRMRPPLTSYIFRCNFEVISLRRLFRSRGDQGLQRIINLMRVPEMSAEGIQEVLHLIEDAFLGCNRVVSPDEVNSDAVWLLSKRRAVSDARDDAFEVARPDDPDVPMDRFKRKYMAEDEHLQAGNWRPASNDRLVTPLDGTCALGKKCYAMVGKRVTVT